MKAGKILILLCFLPSLIFSQISLKGTVIADDDKKILTGVVVTEEGTTNQTVTDVNGKFTISLPQNSGVLVFFYMGMETLKVKVSKSDELFIVLKPLSKELDQIVVIGYGSMKKSDLTGSLGKVNVDDMLKAPVAGYADALAGRVAGVQVVSADGQPGSNPIITIRGANSITQDNAPLYVVDGFPMEDFNSTMLNPSEIESIDILKDASSTAIYGARAANGVILITTKKGTIQKPKIQFESYVGFQNNLNKIELMSPYDFVKYQLELNPEQYATLYLTERTLEDYRNEKGIDWQDEIFRNGFITNNSISLRGGTNEVRYFVSGSVYNQEGIILNSGFRRFNGRAFLNFNLSKNLTAELNINLSNTKKYGQVATSGYQENATAYLMYSVWGSRPVTGRSDLDADFINIPMDPDISPMADYRYNPVVNTKNIYNPSISNGLNSHLNIQYKISPELTLKIFGGISKSISKAETFYGSNTYNGSPYTSIGASKGINGSIINYDYSNLLNENTLSYKKTFNKVHSLDAVAGITFQQATNMSQGLSAIRLPNESLGIHGLREGIADDIYSSDSYSRLMSYIGRANYSYKSKYFLTASFRADGSSKFPLKNRWGYFPSGAIAWRVKNEDFMKDIDVISDLKLRASYGLTGNNRVSDFGYLSQIKLNILTNSASTTSGYTFNNTPVNGAAFSNLGNSELRWESTKQSDLGLDIALFNSRLRITTDVYYKHTNDLLLYAELEASKGYNSALKNIGAVINKGLELTIEYNILNKNDFKWNANFNIAFNRNTIENLNDGQSSLTTRVNWHSTFSNSLPYISLPGRPIALFYGYVFDGLYQYVDFDELSDGNWALKPNVPNNGDARSNLKPGYIKYKDINNDGVVDGNDQTIIGDPNPIHIGGLSNNFTYKNFDLSIFFQWSYGNDILNANRLIFEGAESRSYLNQFKTFADRWSDENQNSLIPKAFGSGPNVYSSRIIEDGSFLRLKTVSFGYNLPAKTLHKMKISNIRLYTSIQNLFTFTNYSGPDPEVSVRPSALTPGFDWSAYPKVRAYTIGLNVNF